jgi:hypothetical protein
LPLVASPSSGFWARGEPVRLGQIDLEPAQALEFTVTGSTDALAGLCRGELQFVVEPTKSTPASTASDEREASWTVHLRGNVQQYSRFPDDPLKDAFVYHDRHVGTIWWEDRELLFAWHAEQDPFFLQRTLARREALGFSVLADSLRFCQLHVRAGEQSRSITLVRPRRLTPVRIDPMSGGTSESIDLAALPRPPGRWNYQTQFTRISGVRLEYSIGATDGQASWNRPQLVFHQLTTDRTAAELNLEATFQLTGEMSRDDKSSLFFVSCRPVSPTASEYQSVRDKRSRNIVERQYLRFAVNTQGRTVVHYRLFLQLGTRFVEVGRTEVEP